MDKVYIVKCEYKVDGVTEFELVGNCTYDTFEKAVDALKSEKDTCLNDYYLDDDYEVYRDNESAFRIQVDDWDRYTELVICELEVK